MNESQATAFEASRGNTARIRANPIKPQLSTREIEVLRMLDAGKPNEQIAAELRLSVNTVRGYCGRAYAKLGVRTAIQATAEAKRRGLIQ